MKAFARALMLSGVATLAGAPHAAAQQQQPRTAFAADASQIGVISTVFWGARGAPVQFFERRGGSLRSLGTARSEPGSPTILKDAAAWSCSDLKRSFEARVTLPDGTTATGEYGVRTPSCAQRFTLRAPRRIKRGDLARIRVSDRWNAGDIRTRLCVRQPHTRRSCRTVGFRKAVTVATRRFRMRTRGRARVELRVRGHRVRRTVAVGIGAVREATPPTVLATGDSSMQGVDSFLSDELGDRATFRSDVQIGSAVSRGSFWTKHARRQARRYRPRVTVMSVGAAVDAFPMGVDGGAKVQCCDEPWIAAYAARVRSMMRSYLRRRGSRVFWLTPPLPRDPTRLKVTTAVNAAVLRAADDLERVTVVRIDLLFSPGGYEDIIRFRGREVRVRDDDGVHLNVSGTAIAAQLLAPDIRKLLMRATKRG